MTFPVEQRPHYVDRTIDLYLALFGRIYLWQTGFDLILIREWNIHGEGTKNTDPPYEEEEEEESLRVE